MTTQSPTTTRFPTWIFEVPADVMKAGLQIAIYGQNPSTLEWRYWDVSSHAYVTFPSSTNGQYKAPLFTVPGHQKSGKDNPVNYQVHLPASHLMQSGVVAMFIGGSAGIPVTNGVPASPTTGTNPNDVFSIFEFTYAVPSNGHHAILDIDISNIDQMGFTYEVTSSGSAPFPLAKVGSKVAQKSLFKRFRESFPAGNAFHECLSYGKSSPSGAQVRLLAPQDVLQTISAPIPPSYLAPTGAPSPSDPFATDNSYFYMVTETSGSGETMPSSMGVFGGFLLSKTGTPTAAQIDIGWLSGSSPGAYHPINRTATGLNIYRAPAPAVDAGGQIPPAPAQNNDYGLITSTTIAAWNQQTGYVYPDSATSTQGQFPPNSSYGFSALSTWFDAPLRDFFANYQSTPFQLYQSNQSGSGSNGTLWIGQVNWVRPKQGQPITSQTYFNQNGHAHPVSATWQWGDGTQAYLVLQLVGNAYDASNLSNAALSGQSGLTSAEYQGAVVNIYFPYFLGNTGLGSVNLPATLSNLPVENYSLSNAPPWMANAANGPSQMVFGCAGVFATPNDPDAVAQNMNVLAQNALTNIQNVIVSGLNRGLATGYALALAPQQYTCLYAFAEAPQSKAQTGAIPAGLYTYYLSALLNNGNETALSWSQTINLTAASAVTLNWGPQSPALYKQVNVYRRQGSGTITLVGTVANSTSSPAISFTDRNVAVPQPTNGAPYDFYPAWNNPASPQYLPSNLYSAFLHQNVTADPTKGISINGLAYGYPFDDQGGFSTNINYGRKLPSSITFKISPLSS